MNCPERLALSLHEISGMIYLQVEESLFETRHIYGYSLSGVRNRGSLRTMVVGVDQDRMSLELPETPPRSLVSKRQPMINPDPSNVASETKACLAPFLSPVQISKEFRLHSQLTSLSYLGCSRSSPVQPRLHHREVVSASPEICRDPFKVNMDHPRSARPKLGY